MIHLMELPSQQRPIQSGLFDSKTRTLTTTIPTTQADPPVAAKPKAIRKKKEEAAAPAAAPVASPESKPKEKAPRKKKEAPAPAPVPVPVPASAPAPVSAAAASAPSAAPKSRAKFAKGSQEAKDYMAAIRAKRGAAKAAVEKAGATPAVSEADDVAVVKKVSRKKKAEKEEPLA